MKKVKRRQKVKEYEKLEKLEYRVELLERRAIQTENKIKKPFVQPIVQAVETTTQVIPEKKQDHKATMVEIDALLEKKRLPNKKFERYEE